MKLNDLMLLKLRKEELKRKEELYKGSMIYCTYCTKHINLYEALQQHYWYETLANYETRQNINNMLDTINAPVFMYVNEIDFNDKDIIELDINIKEYK